MTGARGFTLLELLLATAMATVLMVGILAVIVRLHPDPITATGSEYVTVLGADNAPIDRVTDLLRHDLVHADAIEQPSDDRITIIGLDAHLDDSPTTGESHRPMRISYTIVESAERRFLLRTQTYLDATTDAATQTQLVGTGIRSLRLIPSDGRDIRSAVISPAVTTRNESAEAPDASSGGVAGQVDEFEEITVMGLPYYRKFAPAWAIDEHDRRKFGLTGRGLARATMNSPTEERSPEEQSPAPATAAHRPADTVWRITFTLDGGSSRTITRVLGITPGGAL